jgi:hypothetical protein
MSTVEFGIISSCSYLAIAWADTMLSILSERPLSDNPLARRASNSLLPIMPKNPPGVVDSFLLEEYICKPRAESKENRSIRAEFRMGGVIPGQSEVLS